MSIRIENITKRFDTYNALRGISFEVNEGELLTLLGPSGCGKTTLLRIIAGLEIQDSGRIILFNKDMTSKGVKDRNIGFVFQHFALFKNMNVRNNIAFGLKVKPKQLKPSKTEINKIVSSKLELVQLKWAENRYPAQLSGGEKQRVALARALAIDPKVLLLDEPFGSLDAKVRRELRKWLRHLHKGLHITSIFVTHDQEEALEVSDRIVIMNKGNIEQIGTPLEIYENPANAFVYNFLGNVNQFYNSNTNKPPNEFVRPHDIKITRVKKSNSVEAEVMNIYKYGLSVRIELKELNSEKYIDVSMPNDEFTELNLKTREQVFYVIKSSKIF
jgi:sulfate/thiosulfate transport system ATP-binding protein